MYDELFTSRNSEIFIYLIRVDEYYLFDIQWKQHVEE